MARVEGVALLFVPTYTAGGCLYTCLLEGKTDYLAVVLGQPSSAGNYRKRFEGNASGYCACNLWPRFV